MVSLSLSLKELDLEVRFLVDKSSHGIGGSLSLIIDRVSSDEEFDGWESLDSVLTSELLLNSSVKFGNLSQRSLYIVFFGKVRIGRSHLLAVSTPRSVELDQDNVVLSNEFAGI